MVRQDKNKKHRETDTKAIRRGVINRILFNSSPWKY